MVSGRAAERWPADSHGRGTMRNAWMWIAAAALAQPGCFGTCGPAPGPDPCAQDRLGCEGDPTDFLQLDGCAVTDPLVVTLGEGERAFTPLGDGGGGPEIHFGFQGGQHVFLGFRVDNAALDLYDQLRVTVWMGQGDACVAGPASATVPETCEVDLGLRQVVIGGQHSTLRVVEDGSGTGLVEEFGLLLIIDYPIFGMQTVATVEVEDPCGRTGVASATWRSQ